MNSVNKRVEWQPHVWIIPLKLSKGLWCTNLKPQQNSRLYTSPQKLLWRNIASAMVEKNPHSLPSADLAFSSQMLTLFLRWASSSVKQIGKFWQVSLTEEALTSSNEKLLLAKMKSKETAQTKQGSNGVRPCLSAMFLEAPASKNATIWESKPKDISSYHQINNSPKHASTSFVAAGPLSQASLAMNA